MSALAKWSNIRISNERSFQIELSVAKLCVFLKHLVSVPGHILSGIALTSNIEISSFELRVFLKEISKKCNELFRCLVHVIGMFFTVRETSSDRLIYENEMHDLIPGAFRIQINLVIVGACACSLDPERSVKQEVGEHRAGSRAAVHIDHKGRVSIVICVHPVKHLVAIVFIC